MGSSGVLRFGSLVRMAAATLAVILAGNGCAVQTSVAASGGVAPGVAAPSVAAPGVAAPGAARLGAEWRVFRDAGLGFSFAYPADWVVATGCHSSRNCVAISKVRPGVDDYVLALEVFAGGLERIAVDKAVFLQKPGGWLAQGRSSTHPVEPVTGEGWSGLQAVVDCGVSDRSGMHAAAGECLWAVLSDGKMSVVADTQGDIPMGDTPITDALRRIIRSVRFVR